MIRKGNGFKSDREQAPGTAAQMVGDHRQKGSNSHYERVMQFDEHSQLLELPVVVVPTHSRIILDHFLVEEYGFS